MLTRITYTTEKSSLIDQLQQELKLSSSTFRAATLNSVSNLLNFMLYSYFALIALTGVLALVTAGFFAGYVMLDRKIKGPGRPAMAKPARAEATAEDEKHVGVGGDDDDDADAAATAYGSAGEAPSVRQPYTDYDAKALPTRRRLRQLTLACIVVALVLSSVAFIGLMSLLIVLYTTGNVALRALGGKVQWGIWFSVAGGLVWLLTFTASFVAWAVFRGMETSERAAAAAAAASSAQTQAVDSTLR